MSGDAGPVRRAIPWVLALALVGCQGRAHGDHGDPPANGRVARADAAGDLQLTARTEAPRRTRGPASRPRPHLAAEETARPRDDATDARGFRLARGSRAWAFPRDHAAHPEYATEWWYATGIVHTAEGRTFGYELTFFRLGLAPPGPAREPPSAGRAVAGGREDARSPWRARDLVLAHAAVTDLAERRFLFEQREERAAFGWAGADTGAMKVWVGEWRAGWEGDAFSFSVPAGSTGGRFGLDLELRTRRPPVLHGRGGLSPKDARREPHASWYVSLPRLETAGTLTVGSTVHTVTGRTWMDHEFFSGGLAKEQVGWDWFSCRLEDGRDLMLFRLRDARGATGYAAGTLTSPDGRSWRALDVAGARFESSERWKSDVTGAVYPVAWQVRLPAEDLDLRVRTPLAEQEVAAGRGLGFAYWEGLVSYGGRLGGEAVRGEGYLEMTGYAARLRLP